MAEPGNCSNRMDSGRFESVLKPYKFHQVMRSLFVPLRLATDARKLEFITELDTTIDEVCIVQVCRSVHMLTTSAGCLAGAV